MLSSRICWICTGFSAMILLAVLGFAFGLILNQEGVPVLTPIIEYVAESEPERPVRPAPFAKSDLFEAAFAGAEPAPIQARQQPTALIVNHHLLAPELIAQALQTVATEKKRTVVLISPNHFSHGNGTLIASSYDWQTPYGRLRGEEGLAQELAKAGVLSIEEEPFADEHGIYNILPFIKKTMPNARVLPLIVNDRANAETIYAAAAELQARLPADALIIGSFDFSHGVTDLMADFHDQASLNVLETMDPARTSVLNIDSRPGLSLLMNLARLRNAKKFVLFSHANAVDYTHNSDMTDVTSYITGAYVNGEATIDAKATILAFGDVMMDRMVRVSLEKHGNTYPFEHIRRSLNGSDLTVANLEGSITRHETARLEPDSIKFSFDPSVAPALRDVGFDALSLANNHSRDFGLDGLQQTKTNLDDVSIGYFGDYSNLNGISYTENVGGVKLAFIGFHEFSSTGRQQVIDAIRLAKDVGAAVIVYPHWGIEYEVSPSANQVVLAHQFIDAGADAVLGSHPHVVQPIEIYKEKLIVYSMGNFVFDQQFSQAVKQGLGVGLAITKKGLKNKEVEVYLLPYSLSPTFQVEWYQPNKAADFLVSYAEHANASALMKQDLSDGHFILVP